MLSKHQIVNWLLDCEHIFTEQRDYLTALDTDIGDGDHGLNMQRGFAKGRCEQVPDMRSCLSSGAMEQGSS